MKRGAFKNMVLIIATVIFLRNLLLAQTTVGTISKPDLFPTAVAVYEKGNKVCIADATSGNLLICDSTTLAELAFVPLGLAEVTFMEVNETYGKLYAADYDLGTQSIAVVDLDEMQLVRHIALSPGPSTFPQLAHDEGLDKVYVLYVGGLYQLDVPSDAVTSVPGINGGLNKNIAVNRVTHEVFICQYQYGNLEIINGVTLARTTISGIQALSVGINDLENKVVLGYAKAAGVDFDMCVFDRNTNAVIPLPGILNDALEFAFDPGVNRMYSSSEINAVSAVIEGESNAFFNLPMDNPTGGPKIRLSTHHVYYPGKDYVGVLDDATQHLEIIPVANPMPSSVLYQEVAINQATGRVFVINDGDALNFVTVLQDEDALTRPPVYVGALDGTFPKLFVIDPGSRKDTDAGILAPSFGFPYLPTDRTLAIGVKPGGGRFYVPSGGMGTDAVTVYGGCGPWADLAYFQTGGRNSFVVVSAPDGKTLYQTCAASNSVSRIDLQAQTVVQSIPVGTKPYGAAITPSGSQVWVANKGSDSVSVIDTSTNAVSMSIPGIWTPWGVAINPAGTKAYVSNSGWATVSVIDVRSGNKIGEIAVGATPRWLAFSPDGRYVFVANYDGGSVSVIDSGTDTIVQTVNVGGHPEGICAVPPTLDIYVGTGSNLAVISAETFSVTTVPLQTLQGSSNPRILALAAADQTSRFAGRITASGQPLSGALVRALQGGTEEGRATSNACGDYCIFTLKPGTYSIEFSAAGHSTQTLIAQDVQIGRTSVANMDWDSVVSAITVVSPNGGEIWEPGSGHSITWTSFGAVGDVKIEYSTDDGITWTTAVASTPNDGSYFWTTPASASTQCLVRISEAADGSPSDTSNAPFSLVSTKPVIGLSRNSLSFGSRSATTGSQGVFVSNAGAGMLSWTVTPSAAWITATPGSGTGGGTVSIGVDPTGLGAGTYAGSVAFTDANAWNSPQTVTVRLTVYASGGTSVPFGDFATPIDGTTGITGAIPVTGWVLDDIETTKVEIWRDPVLSAGEVDSLYYIGDGIFVEGARPDVEADYPTYPFNYRAGWGYMLLTNFLPNQGNGTYKLYAIAKDREGNDVTLGTKTIVCDNANAVKPFGTIDTPAQGGDASGNPYLNFGWVLTPLPKTVPTDGSTISVYVDSVLVGTLAVAPNVYDQYRVDVSTNFPGLNNTGAPGVGGPVGAYFLDTTAYPNGVHTIYWVAYDAAGAGDGIGSRYFNIVNAGASPVPTMTQQDVTMSADDLASVSRVALPILVRTGLNLMAESQELRPNTDGIYRVEIQEVDRVEIELGDDSEAAVSRSSLARYSGYMLVGDTLRPLPVGSTLDRRSGRFAWMPGPGFVGTYRLVFFERDIFGRSRKLIFTILIVPKT